MIEMRELAASAAAASKPLPPRYHQLFRLWFIFGFPAFAAVATIYWLMITRRVLAEASFEFVSPSSPVIQTEFVGH